MMIFQRFLRLHQSHPEQENYISRLPAARGEIPAEDYQRSKQKVQALQKRIEKAS
jgi:hypothetical protein